MITVNADLTVHVVDGGSTKEFFLSNFDPETRKRFGSETEAYACAVRLSSNPNIWLPFKSAEEREQERQDALAQDVRDERDSLLAACDWTQVADAPVDSGAWATYRQELRDIPDQEGFPENIVWPTQPE